MIIKLLQFLIKRVFYELMLFLSVVRCVIFPGFGIFNECQRMFFISLFVHLANINTIDEFFLLLSYYSALKKPHKRFYHYKIMIHFENAFHLCEYLVTCFKSF